MTEPVRPFTATDFAYVLLGLGVVIGLMIAVGKGCDALKKHGEGEASRGR